MAVHCRAANLQQHGRGKRTTSNDGIHNLATPNASARASASALTWLTPTSGPGRWVLDLRLVLLLVLGKCHVTRRTRLGWLVNFAAGRGRNPALSPSGRH